MPPNLTSTSYSMWLAAKKEARAETTGKVETISMWLAPSPVMEAETRSRVSRDDENNEKTGESLAESVRRGLLRAGGCQPVSPVTNSLSDSGVESLADQVRAGLMLAGTREDWVVPEVSGDKEDEEEDDSSIVTLDTVTDSSLDLDQFDVMEDTAPLLATWIAK